MEEGRVSPLSEAESDELMAEMGRLPPALGTGSMLLPASESSPSSSSLSLSTITSTEGVADDLSPAAATTGAKG